MAIEDEHVDFVGHMYSQQTLRHAWYGKLPWRQASSSSKLLYFTLQIIMAPIIAIILGIRGSIESAGFRPGMVISSQKMNLRLTIKLFSLVM